MALLEQHFDMAIETREMNISCILMLRQSKKNLKISDPRDFSSNSTI
jgi:hypothetical protein